MNIILWHFHWSEQVGADAGKVEEAGAPSMYLPQESTTQLLAFQLTSTSSEEGVLKGATFFLWKDEIYFYVNQLPTNTNTYDS